MKAIQVTLFIFLCATTMFSQESLDEIFKLGSVKNSSESFYFPEQKIIDAISGSLNIKPSEVITLKVNQIEGKNYSLDLNLLESRKISLALIYKEDDVFLNLTSTVTCFGTNCNGCVTLNNACTKCTDNGTCLKSVGKLDGFKENMLEH
jgi:hypothetical protein